MRERFSVRRIAIAVIVVTSACAPRRSRRSSSAARCGGPCRIRAARSLPGAEVTIVLVATNEKQTVTTDSEGAYVAPNLKPGTYKITVAKQGFKSAAVAEVKLDVQQSRSVDVTLELGQATEVVTVSGRAATVETTSSTVSQTIENKRLVDLPLNGRNPFSLATLAPGVAPAPGSSPFISGGRNATSEVTIDGVSNVNAENNVSILDLNYTPSVDAVQEFSVQTNAVSAEFGRLGGGVINLITKSGSNAFHATAFGFGRNSKLDATNFFTNRAGQKPGSFTRNQFGGNVGGPRLREQDVLLRELRGPAAEVGHGVDAHRAAARSGATATSRICATRTASRSSSTTRRRPGPIRTIPARSSAMPFPGNIIPANRISAVGRALAQYWPLPNTAPSNAFTQASNYVLSGAQPSNGDRIDSRVDHVINDKWRTFVRYSYSDEDSQVFNSFQNARELVGRRRPDVHHGRRACRSTTTTSDAVVPDQRALRVEPALRRSQAAVGRLRPRVARLRQQRRADRAGHRVSAHRRAGLPVARAERRSPIS